MKDYPVRMTLGQVIFVTMCLFVCGFITFYLGARFGPEVFWNIKLDRLTQESLLPNEISEKELALLLAEETLPEVTFHEELQKKGASMGPLDDGKNVAQLVVNPPKGANVKESHLIEPGSNETLAVQESNPEDKKNTIKATEEKSSEVKKIVEAKKPEVKTVAKKESVAKKVVKEVPVKKAKPVEVTQSVSPALNKPIQPSGIQSGATHNDMW